MRKLKSILQLCKRTVVVDQLQLNILFIFDRVNSCNYHLQYLCNCRIGLIYLHVE